jgi:photosynthetic reaction center cytochrome c subunit
VYIFAAAGTLQHAFHSRSRLDARPGGTVKLGWKRSIFSALAILIVYLLRVGSAGGQAPAEEKPLLTEQAFKNIQLLRGMPVGEFMATMGFFSASLNENCTFCHGVESGGSWAKYADDLPNKQMARKMIIMMNTINATYFGGQRMVTCFSCHRGGDRPRVTPSLAEVYGPPPTDEPEEVDAATSGPTADQILDKYIEAIGGAQKLAAITSFTAKGTYRGFDDPEKLQLELYAKAPDQRAMIVHTFGGNSSTIFDGRVGWMSKPETLSPVPVFAITGQDLDGAKLDAELCFPAQIKQALKDWKVGFGVSIDDHPVNVVQGTTPSGGNVKLYFDKKSGLLLRQVRYSEVKLGRVPTQWDYADYRDVSGTKMPFKLNVTWVDGRSVLEITDLKPNAAIDPSKFGKPAPPTPDKAAK